MLSGECASGKYPVEVIEAMDRATDSESFFAAAHVPTGNWTLVMSVPRSQVTGPILRDTGLTRGQMGFALGSWQFVYLFVAIPAGVIMDRFGLRRAIFAGILFVTLSEVARTAAIGQFSMMGAVMIFGLGGPFISVGAPKLTATWFTREEAGLALGIYTVSPSVGSILATSTANRRAVSSSPIWRSAAAIFSIGASA